MRQILRLQAITKFCQQAENLAAFAIAFLSSYDDEEHETVGIFNKISKYSIGEIVNFYANINRRNTDYIAKFCGYPPLNVQIHKAKSFFELSCKNMKGILEHIGEIYIELREFYNAYKHGYRIFLGKDTSRVYLDLLNKQRLQVLS